MFIPVQVEPEVGELAAGYSLPYLVDERSPQIDFVRGIIEKVNSEKKTLKIVDAGHLIPYHRVVAFTFGGIELANVDYDDEKRWKEDKIVIDQLLRSKRH